MAAPGLGLAGDVRRRLEEEVDAVVHCGAFVHHLHGYGTMRAVNVEGTRELLRIAIEKRLKRFCFVSTLTAGAALEGLSAVREAILPNAPAVDNGYVLTKWSASNSSPSARAVTDFPRPSPGPATHGLFHERLLQFRK